MFTLTVDNNPLVVRTVRGRLVKADPGGEHLTAESGYEALRVAEQISPDVVFLDTEMRDMNGLEVARQLKKSNPRVNIVFISKKAEYAVLAFDINASGYLIKPVSEAQILEALQNLRYPISPRSRRREVVPGNHDRICIRES